MSIVGWMDELGKPITPLLVTAGITLVWITVVVQRREAQPVLTLVGAGLVYAVLSVALSGIVSLTLNGELEGPLSTPGGVGVLSTLVVNALWGALAGGLAHLVRRTVGRRR